MTLLCTGTKWDKTKLTWRITKYPPNSNSEREIKVESDVQEAFNVWEFNSGLDFTLIDNEADIEVSFEPQDHGDSYPFDGPGKVVAHAFFPIFGGDVHLDQSETWLTDTQNGPIYTSEYIFYQRFLKILSVSNFQSNSTRLLSRFQRVQSSSARVRTLSGT